ncbi:MAG: sigma-70 family RNA polymerase sigma factor, partial [Mucilaginibacter sp.]
MMKPIESNHADDVLLLQLIEQGSKHAFNVLYEKYWDKAYNEAYKRLKDSDRAKDIVQEIFTHIWLKRETLHIENLPAYLNVAVRNRVLKFIEKQKNTSPFFDILENMPASSSRTDGDLLWKEFLVAYEALLNTLPPKRQTIFRLHFQDDIATKDIAKELGISRKTVQNQL